MKNKFIINKTPTKHYNLKPKSPKLNRYCFHNRNSFCKFSTLLPSERAGYCVQINTYDTETKQNNYISSLITLISTVRDKSKQRPIFLLEKQSQINIQVCKKSFAAVLGVGLPKITSIVKKIEISHLHKFRDLRWCTSKYQEHIN